MEDTMGPWLAERLGRNNNKRIHVDVQGGVKEKNIEVMNDFDDFHPILRALQLAEQSDVVGINYLYADWHVSNFKKQE